MIPPEERPFADRPGYAAFYAEDDLWHTDREAWQRRYGRYHQRNGLIYLIPVLLGIVFGLVGFALCLAHGDPSLDALWATFGSPPLGVVVAVAWWLCDRHRVDPTGTGRRLRGLGWAITAVWGVSKIIK